jgi:hypothetical protein
MAITVSGLYYPTWVGILNASQFAIAPLADTVNVAMYTNSVTPNYSTDTAYTAAPYTTNEVTGTGYTAGGVALGTKTLSESPTGTIMFDAADSAWTTSTITNAQGALIYDITVANKALCFVNFGAAYSTTAGTFTIQWNVLGIFTLDITPP